MNAWDAPSAFEFVMRLTVPATSPTGPGGPALGDRHPLLPALAAAEAQVVIE